MRLFCFGGRNMRLSMLLLLDKTNANVSPSKRGHPAPFPGEPVRNRRGLSVMSVVKRALTRTPRFNDSQHTVQWTLDSILGTCSDFIEPGKSSSESSRATYPVLP